MFRAGSADLRQPLRCSFASSVEANTYIVGSCAFRVRVLSDRPSLHVHRLQGVAVLGLERFENTPQALTDIRLPLRLVADRSLRRELFVGAVAGCVSPVVIDRRMTQDGVEPGDNAFILLKLRSFLDQFEVAGLQDVFCRRRTDFCRQKAQKGAPLFKQLRGQPGFPLC